MGDTPRAAILAGMTSSTWPRWRRLVVWLHVLSSVGWMAQAVAMAMLSATAISATDQPTAVAAVSMAQRVDTLVLVPMANAAAFTGFFLALTTAWGLTRHWWVLVKAAITVSQLYLGIVVLSAALDAAEVAVRTGDRASAWLPVGAGLMVAAIAFQAWVSIAKPWGPVRRAGRASRLPVAPGWLMRLGVLAPVTDTAVGVALGAPLPALSVLVLVIAAVQRRRSTRTTSRPLGGRAEAAPAVRA